MKKLLVMLMLCLSGTILFAGEFPDISMAELEKAIESKSAVIIDVNGTKSYQKGHIPTAINFVTEKENLANKLPSDKNALIVAYCGGPSCNAYQNGAKAAAALGYTNIKHFSAGISGWLQAGKPTEKAK